MTPARRMTMKTKIENTGRIGTIQKIVILAASLVILSGCSAGTFNRQAVTDSLMVPQFAMLISSEEASFMMGPDKNGAVYCFEKGMRMELRGYTEEGKIFINPGAIGTHELQHILNCIDPDKYGEPDNNWELEASRKNGVQMIAKRGNF